MGRRAIVVGGGIGGLTAAVALRRRGWEVTVLEQAHGFTQVGAGLTLWSNALAALDEIGLGDAVRDHGSIAGAGGTRTWDGDWLSRIPAGDMERLVGMTAVGIHRADLVDLLRTSLPPQAVITAAEVVAVEADGRPTVVYRHDGQEHRVETDLVVAADGINSGVRRALWEKPGKVRFSGITAWRAVTPQPWAEELASGITWGSGTEFGAVRLGDGRVYWFGALNAPAGGRATDELREVTRVFGHWHDPIPRLMAATPAASVLRNDLFHLSPGPATFVRGRVVLLGDAAHAMTPHLGQGACQAIEDAVVLGMVLDEDAVDPALEEYDRLRRPRTRSVARLSRLSGRLGQQLSNPAAVAVRNHLVRLVPPRRALGPMAQVAAWRP